MVLSSEPEMKVSSTGDMESATTLKEPTGRDTSSDSQCILLPCMPPILVHLLVGSLPLVVSREVPNVLVVM